MTHVAFEIIVILLLILLNGLFALSETAVIVARKSRLQDLASQGNRSAERALELARNPEHLLSTVQLGITLVGILTGVFGGATLARELGDFLAQFPQFGTTAHPIALVIVVFIITFASIVIGELAPKKIAIVYADRIAITLAVPLSAISRLLTPFVVVLSFASMLITRIFNVSDAKEPAITEEEITIILEEGTEAGVVEEVEQNIVRRVLRMGDRRVDSLMTPRTDMIWLEYHASLDEISKQIADTKFGHYPVCHQKIDDVRGTVALKDLWALRIEQISQDWKSLVRPSLVIPGSTSVLRLLEHFQERGVTVAVVVDEYGGVDGWITLDDIVQSVLGPPPANGKEEDCTIVQRTDGSWLVDGAAPVEDLMDFFDLEFGDDDTNRGFQTLAGFVMSELGHVPKVAEAFEFEGFRFEVMDMDGHRVDKVLVSKLESDSEGSDINPII